MYNRTNNFAMYNRTHSIPAIFSFFMPGFGQLVKGHIFKAFTIWIIGGIISFYFWWTIIIPFSIWVWNIYDAYSVNSRVF